MMQVLLAEWMLRLHNGLVQYKMMNFLKPMIKDINGSIITEYDDQITNAFHDVMKKFLAGETTEEQMWAQWKKQHKNDLSEITTEEHQYHET